MMKFQSRMTNELSSDADIMNQVLRLAARGRGGVEPNPMVGCIIVKDGAIIGQGYHQKYGGPHAEPVALDSRSGSPQGATAYVNLEPCCHLDKQTPPCVPRLIDAKVTRVVVGCSDPNPSVNRARAGGAVAAGIVVDEGVLGGQAKQLNAAYFKQVAQCRPFVTLKWCRRRMGRSPARWATAEYQQRRGATYRASAKGAIRRRPGGDRNGARAMIRC